MLEKYRGKTILIISPKFQNIYKLIMDKMEEYGMNVIFYDGILNNSVYIKTISRLAPTISEKIHIKYYSSILESIKDKEIDYLLVFKGEILPKFFLENIKNDHPDIKKVLYLYDSTSNYPETLKKIMYFDRVLTFDNSDSKKYGFEFRPLFYSDDFIEISSYDYKYDISFIGTVHSDRYRVLKSVREKYGDRYRLFLYMYVQAKAVYYAKRIFNRDFRKGPRSDFKFKSMSHSKSASVYAQSKCIIDIQQEEQSGLTMRAIEALGCSKKLITTNEDIKNYDFYLEDNILIVNRHDIIIPNEFIENDYIPVDKNIIDQYSLEYFIAILLKGDEVMKTMDVKA